MHFDSCSQQRHKILGARGGVIETSKQDDSSSVILHRCLSKLFLQLFKNLSKLTHDSSCSIIPNQSHCPSLQSLQGVQIPVGYSTLGTAFQTHPSMVPNIMRNRVLQKTILHTPLKYYLQFYSTHCFAFCISAIR